MAIQLSLSDLSLAQIVGYAFLSYCVYYILSAIFCLYFHSLAQYPGPLLARVSVWPSFWHTLKGNRHIWLWQLQEIYGPVVRYRPDALLFQTPTAFRAIYDTKANARKAKQYQAWARHVTAQTTFTAVDKGVHARKRRVLNAAFSDKVLRSANEISVRHIDRWCELLADCPGSKTEAQWTEPKNMTEWSDYLILDILTELSFGKSFETKEPGENLKKGIPHIVARFMKLMYPIISSPFLDVWLWLKPRGLDRLVESSNFPEGNQQMMAIIDSCLSHRIEEEALRSRENRPTSKGSSKDLLHYLLQADDPEGGPGFTPLELRAETEVLLAAGFDTTSAVLAAMFFYLTRNACAYAKLVQEIRQTFARVDDIATGQLLSSCRYLRAVIDETMRMSPPGVAEGIREVLPGGLVIDDHVIPAGVNVGTALYALHHNQNIFHDPFIFRPERWIVSETVSAASVAEVESACFPFSIGSRGCPGKRLAYQEMSTAMAKAVCCLDFRAVEGDQMGVGGPHLMWGRRDKTQWQVDDALVVVRDGPLIQFRARSTSHEPMLMTALSS